MRSAASRAAAEVAAKLASLPGAVKMSVCPVCDLTIYSDQHTAWASLDDTPTRIHRSCAP